MAPGWDSTGTLPFELRYRWTGREYDAELGWYYFRSRYYDPGARRFTQEDPAGYAGSGNLYAYVEGSLLEYRDPSGLGKDATYFGGNPHDWSGVPGLSGDGSRECSFYCDMGGGGLGELPDRYEMLVAYLDAWTTYIASYENLKRRYGVEGLEGDRRSQLMFDGSKPLTKEQFRLALRDLESAGFGLHPAAAYLKAGTVFRLSARVSAILVEEEAHGDFYAGTHPSFALTGLSPLYFRQESFTRSHILMHEYLHTRMRGQGECAVERAARSITGYRQYEAIEGCQP